MALTPEIEKEILQSYFKTHSPHKTARKVGVSADEVFSVIAKQKQRLDAPQERNGGYGREELRPYLVARHVSNNNQPLWDNSDPDIAEARNAYEAGTHILTTGRDGSFRLLYSIPRKGTRDPMPNYFRPEVA